MDSAIQVLESRQQNRKTVMEKALLETVLPHSLV